MRCVPVQGERFRKNNKMMNGKPFAMSLGGTPKKKKAKVSRPPPTAPTGFATATRKPETKGPMVIPLVETVADADADDEDAAAAAALTAEARGSFQKEKLSMIPQISTRRDQPLLHGGKISGTASDDVDYESVPVDEFGAALLRGMGWSGTRTETFNVEARPHRLGLGATPKPMELFDKRGNLKRKKDETCLKRKKETWLVPGIRVRVAKRSHDDFRKKGIVLNVQPPRIQFDDAVCCEVPENHLETVLPSDGGRVLVLRGPQIGHVGTLRSRDKTCLKAQVHLENNVLSQFHYNDIAELCHHRRSKPA